MKLINSLTHSCMHSFASFAILAFSGSAVFMIRATGAKLRMSVSANGFSLATDAGEPAEASGGASDATMAAGIELGGKAKYSTRANRAEDIL